MNILEAAKLYTSKGWVVHPLSKPDDKGNSPGKKPLLTNWSELKRTPDDIGRYIKKGYNIGLVCGKASGVDGIDIDLDLFTDELFEGVEIHTLTSRHRAGRGHILFQHEDDMIAEKHHFIGLEYFGDSEKGTGSNLVLPPSKHYSGELYQWDDVDVPVAKVSDRFKHNWKQLANRENALHDYFKKCRRCFTVGSKKYHKDDDVRSKGLWDRPDDIAAHGMDGRRAILAILGELKTTGCPDDLMHMACKRFFGKDYDAKVTDESLKHIKPIHPKCETLRQYLNVECDGCTWKAKPDINQFPAAPETGALIPELSTDEINELSSAEKNRRLVLSLPEDHFLTQYVKWISSISDGYAEYSISCGLWILSAVTKGKFVLPLKQEKIKPNLWIFNIGKSTTSRKSTIVNMTRRITECSTDCILPNQDYSLEGYLEYLSFHPITNNVRDEAAGLLFKFHQKYNDGIFDLECQLYDSQNIEKTLASKGKKEPQTFKIIDPFITKLYATTPENLSRALSIDDFLSGYGYRWIFSFPNYPHVRKPLSLETPEDITAWGYVLTKIKRMYNNFDGLVAPVNFNVTDEAMVYFDSVCQELESKVEESNNDILNSVVGRSEIHILKIAMLLELGKYVSSTTIDINSIEVASKMVTEFFIPSIMDLISQLQEDIKNNKIEKLTSILRRLGGNAHRTKLLRDSNLVAKEFSECIETMLVSGKIKAYKNSESKGTVYILQDHTDKLKVRSVRKVRNVRTYIDIGGTPTNITNNDSVDMIDAIDAHQGVGYSNVLTNFTNSTNPTNSLSHNPGLVSKCDIFLKLNYDQDYRSKPAEQEWYFHMIDSMKVALDVEFEGVTEDEINDSIEKYLKYRGWI